MCQACLGELPWHRGPQCPVCALPTPLGEVCGRCLRRPPHFDATLALFRYETPLREMVLALKHGHGLALVPFFAERLPPLVEREVDVVLPVPLHAARLRTRGFNQSVEVAASLARALARPLERDRVVRDVDTPHQVGARRAVRRRNVRGAFRCMRRFDGQHVLVLDDVMTSGATLDELARTLKLAGAARVTNLVLARTLLVGKD